MPNTPPAKKRPVGRRPGSLLISALALTVASAQAADSVPLDSAPPPAVRAGAAVPTLPPADLATRCFDAVMKRASLEDGAWCDVQIDTLNRRFDRTPQENAELLAAYHNRAVLRTRDGQFELAAADLAAALELEPGRPELYLTRGNLHMAEAEFVQALEDYNRAIEQSGGREAAYFRNRALVLRALGEVEAAAADALRARAAGLSRAPAGTGAGPGVGSR